MTSISTSTTVAAPIEDVFDVYTDLENAVQRIPDITALEILSEGPFGQGTRWRETRVMFKKATTEEMWVKSFDPPNSYTVEANSHGMLYETLFEFVPEGNGTIVRWTFKGTPQSFVTKLTAPLFGLFFKGMMRKCMQRDLDALRDACEAESSDAAVVPKA